MAGRVIGGPRWGTGTYDADGHRTWPVTFQVQVDDLLDGPAVAAQTPGLPLPGDFYVVGNDVDVWAWFRAGPVSIQPERDKGNQFFWITYQATTRPPDAGGPGGSGGKDDAGSRKRCADSRIEDPLSEPPATSGSSVRYSREAEYGWDPVNNKVTPFRYTSFEKVLGSQREFDAHREQVIVEQNVINLERSLVKSLLDKLNDSPLWDMPARCWKLSDWNWQRKLYGVCNFYYTRRLVFECDALEVESTDPLFTHPVISPWLVQGPDGRWWLPGWDKVVLDESDRVLNGKWNWISGGWVPVNINGAPPDYRDPRHYIKAHDRAYNPQRYVLSRTNRGQPMTVTAPPNEDDDANYVRMQFYPQGNMFALGIPVTLD